MSIKIEYRGAIIHCETQHEFNQVVDGLGLRGNEAPALVAVDLDQISALIANLRGTPQEDYLQLIVDNPSGIVVSEIIRELGLTGLPALNGTWSGVSKNCKKVGFLIPTIIERRKRPSDGEVIHKPTDLFLQVWRKST